MIIYPPNTKENKLQLKAAELKGIGKKYPLAKAVSREAGSGFDDFWALRGVSFTIEQSKVYGIIGRNGAGKTTLLNIIAGTLSCTEGKITTAGRVIGLFNLGVGFQDELSGEENIFLNGAIVGATRKELQDKLTAIIDFSELGEFMHMPLGSYSQGMRLRLAFSIIANLEFDILVIDEVLAVGDALFQNKCFQRLMDFRRAGKTLIITTQSMELIERLCDEVVLLDHGFLLFEGNPPEALDRYRALMHSEKFFVGPGKKNVSLITDTKRWAEDISSWGNKLGTKEAVIDSVAFINKFGFQCAAIKTKDPLRVRVHFTARDTVKEPHFGVAIFRSDGVYCYGPNTEFDGYKIPELKKGKGWFELKLKQMLLAPGEYRISVAIWDNNETLAFDYHNGYYRLCIRGDNPAGELVHLPFKVRLVRRPSDQGQGGIRLLDNKGQEKNIFMTNDALELESQSGPISIFRDDGVLCQKINIPSRRARISFSGLPLLPGKYNIFQEGTQPRHFSMVFGRQDHGTVHIEHQWRIGGRRWDTKRKTRV
jgi:lipopolysaccharide transport system ATP-binding protein